MTTKSSLFGHIYPYDLLWLLFLLIPALYINLGMLPLGGDESIRALVSIEMMLSGDYLTPTLNGELYLNKPPLYNWLLISLFNIFNSNSEFVCRLPTTLFLIIYCITIFWFVKKHLGVQSGILASVLFLTCGRILFRDSFLGLIDTAFSWIIFLNFMLIWNYFEKQRYLYLFLISYALTAVGFLLKGLPALAFQGLTLLTLFISTQNFKKLLSFQHVFGIIIFFLFTGIYYFLYYMENPEVIGKLLTRIVTESTQKSAAGVEFVRTIKHLVEFPYEITLHFAPWTFMVILVFNKPIWKRALTLPFIRYCVLVFLVNLSIYWLSPVTYMRYLLMLFPLQFIVFLYLAKFHALINTPLYRLLKKILLTGMVLLIICITLLPVIFKAYMPVEHLYLKSSIILLAGLATIFYLYLKRKNSNLVFTLALILLLGRISFNLFLVPYRQIISWQTLCRKDAIELAEGTRGNQLFLMTDTITIPNAYYITRERNEILRFRETYSYGPYYIIDDSTFNGQFRKEYSMRIPMNARSFYAGRFLPAYP